MRSRRFTAALLLIVTIFALFPTAAFANDGFDPIDAVQAAGGNGTLPGSIEPGGNSGIWNDNFQGFRITVLDYSAAPAFTFMGKDYMDLVFSTRKIKEMNYFGDGCKTQVYRGIFDSANKLNSKILTIGDIGVRLNSGEWSTAVPNPDNLTKAISKMSANTIPKPLILNGDTWIRQGTAIKNVFYGKGDTLDETALLYVIMNLHSKDEIGNLVPLWQPKSGAYFGNNPITSEELSWLKEGRKPDGSTYTPIQLMSDKGLVISVEPIIWNNLRESKTKFSYGVYGTQTTIGGICKWLEGGGWFNPTYGKGIGGWDSYLFGELGRQSMLVDNTGIQFPSFVDKSGNRKSISWTIMKPNDKGQKVTDAEVYELQLGWSLHLYLLKKQNQVSSTHTFDASQGLNPHAAPDPKDIPLQENEDVSKTRVINIVKTYMDDREHVATFSRTKNPAQITIEDEPEYKVTEWFISETYNNPTQETTWEENHAQAPATGPTGTKPSTVNVEKPNTTLYVLLERKPLVPEEPTGTGDLTIRESQVTKAAETIDSSIVNWGPKTMSFSADDISGTCPYAWYCSSDSCSGHSCGAPYVLEDTSWSYNHRNTEAINKYLHADIGKFKAVNDRGADATGERGTVSTYFNNVDSFNYKLVVWRGKDIPTIASYKEPAGHELKDLVNRYGNTPQGKRYDGIHYTDLLKITLDKDAGNGDYTTTSITDHKKSKSADHINTNTLSYDANVKVEVYWGKQHKRGEETSKELLNLQTTLVGKPSLPKYSGGRMLQDTRLISFYPYIRMTYQVTGQQEPSRTNVNILSQWLSEMLPNDYVEAAWASTAGYNLNLRSPQWSLHSKATAGQKGWDYPNRVLPGGAIYTLDTKDNRTWVSVVSWQPYLEEEVRTKVITKGSEYKYSDTEEPHKKLVEEATKALESWRVVQYVKNYNQADGKTPSILEKDSTMALDGLKVGGGGESLSSLGLTGKSSGEDKYYMKKSGTSEAANEGDLDIISTTTIEIKYKVTADVTGKIHVYRDRDNSGWVEIFTMNKDQGAEVLTGEVLALDQRTKVITNLCTVLTRNTGNDKTASWASSDGHWYNEAFDGICYTRRETCFEVGFKIPPSRSAALDPALCPVNLGQSDLFSKAFVSQFFMNDKSDAYPSEMDGFIGKFKGTDVVLAGYKEMMKSMPFAIPNVNVQDLN